MPWRPGWLVTAFVLAMLLPGTALVWLAMRFLEQDRILEEAQARERQELSADRAVAHLEQAIAASERLLNGPENFQAEDAVIVVLEKSRISAYPRQRLLFYPVMGPSAEDTRIFENAERIEFQEQDLRKAIDAYRELARDDSPSTRAGALVRLARTLRKSGYDQQALHVYSELSLLQDVRINGVPAGLVAARARTLLLAQPQPLAESLISGKWQIDRATFDRYAGEFDLRPDPKRLALSAAVDWLSTQSQPSGRGAKDFDGIPITILWSTSQNRLSALVAGPEYQTRHWFSGLDRAVISINGARPSNAVIRTAAATGLPWTITVKPGPVPNRASRRPFVTAGLGVLALAVLATVVLLALVLSRELAVARLKSDFVAAVSHEFRTPLTTLRQYTEMLLEEDHLSPAEHRQYLEAQQRATERLHRLVESLLDFRRMEARAWTYRMQAIDVGTVVTDVVDEFRRETAGRGFTVSCQAGSLPAPVHGDPEALGRALWNLLDNAMKYSGQARRIEVGVARQNGHVKVSVRDYGAGVPKADRKRIFERFVRGDDSRRNGIQGTGIGLAMVRHIAGAHGGCVELLSEPARGSTFTIVLPLQETTCSES